MASSTSDQFQMMAAALVLGVVAMGYTVSAVGSLVMGDGDRYAVLTLATVAALVTTPVVTLGCLWRIWRDVGRERERSALAVMPALPAVVLACVEIVQELSSQVYDSIVALWGLWQGHL
jgi:hypothetical protein